MANDDTQKRQNIVLLILAGVGAGTLIGAVIGLIWVRRGITRAASPEAVGELTEKAHRVLDELSENVSALVGKSRAILETVQESD